MSGDKRQQAVEVVWEGDSLDVVQLFPKAVRLELGLDIRRIQDGEKPHDSRSMRSVGQGVYELRQRDANGWYRLIYLKKIGTRVFMLHGFVKKSGKTSRNDLDIAKKRLRQVQARLAEERKSAKKDH